MKIRQIRFPDQGKDRVAEIVKRSNSKPTGKFPSWKMGRMMQWESVSHLCAFRLLDCDPLVQSFAERPLEIVYEYEGVIQIERPDILVVINGQKELWKIARELECKNWLKGLNMLSEELLFHGYFLKTVSSDDMGSDPRLKNAVTILKFGRREISPEEREQARCLFLARPAGVLWSEILGGIAGPSSKNVMCRLVLEGVVHVDQVKLWCGSTLFTWADSRDERIGSISL
ncbi:hypothetical protein ICN11_01320 [Polynucleobacter sp. 78F-HAINBA]|uniref:hypothetical protein n=1 Tax=Polynucleobacter sp. 78F-HAINBA TaxID=2689099 RepID=UPI001C0CA3D8|nr:hypothetical protein [Polynucleobacter sp. 78F-HAINBA]MBU3590660.1 hypothetical protein [Polynucleobacter sp. 78F-HAINBA]